MKEFSARVGSTTNTALQQDFTNICNSGQTSRKYTEYTPSATTVFTLKHYINYEECTEVYLHCNLQ